MAGNHSASLVKAIREGEFVPMDGALGTELERRGVPMEGTGWSAFAVRDHGDVIREVHEDYIRAGAQLHIVNSFALARHVLEPIGLGDQFEYLNRQAVVLFDDAVANSGVDRHSLWVAGSMSTFAANSDRSLLPGDEVLVSNYRDQARILHDAGVDLFALEMLFDIDVSLAMFEAAAGFNLPVIMGFTCDLTDSSEPGVCTGSGMGYPGIPLEQVLRTVIDSIDTSNVIFSIMHSEADVTDVALKVLKTCWDGPVAIYPNSGQFVDLRMQFDSVCSPDEFQQAAGRWADAGVQIIGGCCGIGPTHIERLKESVHSWQGIR